MRKAVLDLYASIEASNKKFKKMTPAQKRVQIARDVIAQLRAGQFEAQQGVYVDSNFRLKDSDLTKQLSDILPKVPKCTVCGIGSAFLCAISRADNMTVEDATEGNYGSTVGVEGDTAYDYLRAFFSTKQLNAIENAFEQNHYLYGGDFAEDVDDDNERLRLIWENVVVNKGRFNPDRRPVVSYATAGFTA